MKKFAIALFAIAAASAFAGEASYEEHNAAQFSGQLTRAEVKAQFDGAKRSGALGQVAEYAVDQNPGPAATSSIRSRAEVRAEAVQAARTRVVQELI